MRDALRRLAALEARIVKPSVRWDFSGLPDGDLAFLEECGRLGSVMSLAVDQAARLQSLLSTSPMRVAA